MKKSNLIKVPFYSLVGAVILVLVILQYFTAAFSRNIYEWAKLAAMLILFFIIFTLKHKKDFTKKKIVTGVIKIALFLLIFEFILKIIINQLIV